MRLGLLADIHEEVEWLRRAIDALQKDDVSKFVVLGDVFDTGQRIAETVDVLRRLDSVGVWGNHDFGLCRHVEAEVRDRYAAPVLDYFGGLQPWLEVAGCRFQHIEPFLNSEDLEDLWSYGGGSPLNAERSFSACSHQRIFMGHIHRWEVVTPSGVFDWTGAAPVRLGRDQRCLIVVHAVQQGWCGWYDVEEDVLHPIHVG
jgi:hypothetical protein